MRSYSMYFFWRVFLAGIILITSPIWIPIMLLVGLIASGIFLAVDYYKTIRRDWERKHGIHRK